MNEYAVVEQAVDVVSAKAILQGTLTLPGVEGAEPSTAPPSLIHAAVLLLADSGPLDRNQNSVQVQLNIFSEMANYLAGQGIASIRYDKRGCGVSKGKFDSAGHSDLVADAQVWLDYLHQHSAVKDVPVYVLGHGEGSLIASQLSAHNSLLQGQVLLTPFVENFEHIIRRQAENALQDIAELEGFKGKLIRFFLRLSGDQLKKQTKLIQRIRKTRRDTLKIRKQVINAKWIREMVNLDARTIHATVSLPTLLIGGEKDLQCLPEDVAHVAELIKAPVESHLLSDLTHILRSDPDKPSVQHYLMLTLEPVDRRLLEIIKNWLISTSTTSASTNLSKA